MSAMIFVVDVVAFVLVVAWMWRVEQRGPDAAAEGLFAMKAAPAEEPVEGAAPGQRWRSKPRAGPARAGREPAWRRDRGAAR